MRNRHNKQIKTLMVANRDLQTEVEELQGKIVHIEQRETERRDQEDRKHREEV